jgi:hypothetical protein
MPVVYPELCTRTRPARRHQRLLDLVVGHHLGIFMPVGVIALRFLAEDGKLKFPAAHI